MKSWFLASALLFASAGLASAEYVVIIANVGTVKELQTQPGAGMAGGGMRGMQGMPPGMGNPGALPTSSMRGNQGGLPTSSMRGNQGGLPTSSMRGNQGGLPTSSMMGNPNGMRGGPNGMRGGMMGMRGGMMGMRGGMGGPMGMGDTTDVDDVPEFIIAIVELNPVNPNTDIHKKLTDTRLTQFPTVSVKHKWGKSTLLARTKFAQTIVLTNDSNHKPLKSVPHRFDDKFKKLIENKPRASEILEMADWTLEHGLVDKFPQVMDKLVEIDKSNPAAVAYLKVKAELNKPIKDDTSAGWRSKLLRGYKVDDESPHYTIIHNSPSVEAVKSHKELLENSLKGFYYWFALKGVAQPMPNHRQVVVLTGGENKDFRRLHKILTSGPVVVDGFFARRENLAVMTSKRQDETYDSLKKFWRRWEDRSYEATKILSGKSRAGYPAGTSADDIHVAQLVALMVKALEQEGELATISHDASRQLLYASGLLPSNVAAPEWLLFGMGSFFETPLQSPWAGIGAPSAYYLPRWKELKGKRLEKKPGDTLRKVVTDAYFRALPPEGKPESPERHAHDSALRKARTAAWSLTYFLAKQRFDGLQNYFKELSKMPRDIELDDEALLACFARAFGKVDRNNKVVNADLNAMERDWFSYMGNVKFESESTMKKIQKIFKDKLEETKNAAKNNAAQGQGQQGGFGPGMNPQGPGGFRPPGAPNGPVPPGGFSPRPNP